MATDDLTDRRTPETHYGRYWDYYIDQWARLHNSDNTLEWPGDEWGNPAGWEGLYTQLFTGFDVATWERAVEIGPGSGKYTLRVIDDSKALVRGYDVSEKFMEVCRSRCAPAIDDGRLSLHLLHGSRPGEMLADIEAAGWRGTVDAFYSIDAMVHVDLQYLIVYLITGGLVLREGGRLILTLADATRDAGFQKLVNDIAWTWRGQASVVGSGKFEWLSPDIVSSILPRIGFHIELLDLTQRDIRVVARLDDPERARSLESSIVPAG